MNKVHGLKIQQNIKINKRRRFKQNIPLMAMFAPALLFFIIFKYLPMGGLMIAFKDYNFSQGVFGSPWVGLKHFEMLFSQTQTLKIIRNTFWLSILSIICGFPAPIILALLLNEVKKMWYKKSIQTIVYLPHFFSWVIIGGMVIQIFSQESGIINQVITKVAGKPFPFLYKGNSWTAIFIGAGIWKEMGFKTIIYLAALSNVNPSLYESADIDGANKWKKTWKITIPGISSTIVILFILAAGRIMEVGFDPIYVLQNKTVNDISDVISTYILRVGLQGAQFSITTAMGLFESFVGLVLVLISNWVARRFDEALW